MSSLESEAVRAQQMGKLFSTIVGTLGTSYNAVKTVRDVMIDSHDRTDDEIFIQCKAHGSKLGLDTITHGRRVLFLTGFVIECGSKRKTSRHGFSQTHIWCADTTMARMLEIVVSEEEFKPIKRKKKSSKENHPDVFSNEEAERFAAGVGAMTARLISLGGGTDPRVTELNMRLIDMALRK